jgi:hypothetical protein
MFVCLWSPTWRTAADSLADLSPALLTVAPRVVTEERRGGLVWVDARGLDAEHIARSALEVLRGLGLANVNAGIGTAAIVAEIAAAEEGGGRGKAVGCWVSELGVGCRGLMLGDTQPPAQTPNTQHRHPTPNCCPPCAFLSSLPIAVLEPDPALSTLLEGIGVETCGDLAALEAESVEIRLGAGGVRLWKLARGDDDRLIFSPIPRELPHASLEWSDYALADTERLLFSVNALLGTVCEKLVERGSLAREMTLDLRLASGDTLTNAIRAGRTTASRKTWLRLARASLERLVLPAGVVGVALRAAAVVTDDGHQGDLFDRGFATAAATEAALASLAEDQGDVVVVPENTAHPLVERRTKWKGRLEGERRERRAGGWVPPSPQHDHPAPGTITHHPILTPSTQPPSSLTLYLLPTPRAIEVHHEARRDHVVPTAYRDGDAWYAVLSAAGPDRVSGERWGEGYAREYFRCIVDDGGMVWLYRDARADGWYLHGWWD